VVSLSPCPGRIPGAPSPEGTNKKILRSTTLKRLAFALAITATLGSSLVGSANADPKQLTGVIGVGSDTVQDVMNAFAGTTNGTNYVPLQSSVASGQRQIVSFDAVPPAGVTGTCITVKPGAPTVDRPNGSGAGQKALSRAIDTSGALNANKWGNTAVGNTCGGLSDVSGLFQFARSSAGPTDTTTTALTYIPFGRDGVSFAYYRASGGAAVTSLTKAQLVTLYTTGPQTIGGVRIVPCGIQTSSGTYKFWNQVTGATAGQEDTATTECRNYITPGTGVAFGRSEENDGTALKARGDVAAAGDQVIIAFSAASFIAKSNLAAPGLPPAGVGMGQVSNNGSGTDLGVPVTGTAPNLLPSATFYNDATFGRFVYTVVSTAVITSAFGNTDLKTLFSGSTSAVCQATATINKFGFLDIPGSGAGTCGDLSIRGALVAGNF
jgi:hypothetical protein